MTPAPPVNASPNMFCRSCGYALIGLPANRCPECGRDFDPADPKTFLARPRRTVLRRIVKVVLVLFCLTLPADAYLGYLDWQVHREKEAIQFLCANGALIEIYNTAPPWSKHVLRGHATWLWDRADEVYLLMPSNSKNIPQAMVAVGNLKLLRKLFLGCGAVTDRDLVNLKGLKALQTLDLTETRVTDAGLVNLRALTGLRELFLQDIPVTDAGLVNANIRGMTSLETLVLNFTNVTDAGLAEIKGLTDLHFLGLGHTLVTDAGLGRLKRLAALGYLDLSHTQVSGAAVAALQKSLPWCRIDH